MRSPAGAAVIGAARPAARHTPRGGTLSPLPCGRVREPRRGAVPSKQMVEAFNAANPVGTAGYLLRDNGAVVPTKVAAPAQLLAGHVAVACFEGLRGFFSIERFVRD